MMSPTIAKARQKERQRERRERIAVGVLTSMVGDPSRRGKHEDYVFDAIRFTDALIAELDKDA